MATLQVNFEWENLSDESIESGDFENMDELSKVQFKLPVAKQLQLQQQKGKPLILFNIDGAQEREELA